MFYCRSKSFEYLNSPKFHFVKSWKLSALCSKKLLHQSPNKDFSKSLKQAVAKNSSNEVFNSSCIFMRMISFIG